MQSAGDPSRSHATDGVQSGRAQREPPNGSIREVFRAIERVAEHAAAGTDPYRYIATVDGRCWSVFLVAGSATRDPSEGHEHQVYQRLEGLKQRLGIQKEVVADTK